MGSPVLVTGGTGTLGRLVVPLLRAAGHPVRVLSRHGHASADGVEYVTGDLRTGAGLSTAVDGAELVIHLAGAAKGDDETTRTLIRALPPATLRHLVYISVIGADRVPLGYFRAKLGAERAVAESGLPWTTLRAAQFHGLVLGVLRGLAKLPAVPVPGVRFQPVDARDVAERLVALALDEPAGLAPDLPGPQVYGLAELCRGYLGATGRRRLLLPVRLPGAVGRAYRAGENLTVDGAAPGTRTWEAFLAEQLGR